ncbi:MAG TPA: YdeI/OmpD-associated family protein [Magnetospirillaceae bacterium]|nr:YdeI/OmpD-associated family protein [Magnetospirillaceae bacterium]
MIFTPDLEVLSFDTQSEFRNWLETHHASSPGIWLKIAKKGKGIVTVNYDQALEEALCYGWIDGQSRRLDDIFYLQRFTPRRSKSIWSQINREHIARLTKAGKMRPAGSAAVEAAKKDGRWDAAYASWATAKPPEDFIEALNKNPKARDFYATLNRQNTFGITFRIGQAKRPETRQARIKKFVDMLAEGKKPIV